MENVFSLKELILENRVEEVKKKYPDVSTEFIEQLASEDPSGNNKYLDWMVKQLKLGVEMSDIVKYIKLFHENINKLTKENFDEVIKNRKWDWLLTDTSPIAKVFQKMYKSPKDINSYDDFDILKRLLGDIKGILSKAEIKKLEADVLYESDDLLIMIPKSYRSSCYYGAGTRWCTTNKESDFQYNKYSKNGVLIYIIYKKEDKNNPWYKTAFHIEHNGHVTVYDAPDNPNTIKTALTKLKNWDLIRDVIVEFLYKNNLNGVENFYFGHNLLSWFESKDLNPLKILSKEQLIDKLGLNTLVDYLVKKNINIFNFLDIRDLYFYYTHNLETQDKKSFYQAIKNLWDDYKKNGINPLPLFIEDREVKSDLFKAVIHGYISLDELLHFIEISGKDLFEITNNMSDQTSILFKLFNDDIDLLLGYANSINVNLLQKMYYNKFFIKQMLNKKFNLTTEEGRLECLKYILNNITYIKDPLSFYGFGNSDIINYLSKSDDGLGLMTDLVLNNKINSINITDINKITKNPKESLDFWVTMYVQNNYTNIDLKNINDNQLYEIVTNFLRSNKYHVLNIFPSMEIFNDTIKQIFNKEWDVFDKLIGDLSKGSNYDNLRVLLKSFYNDNYYELYIDLYEKKLIDKLDTLFLIKCYEDSPVKENTGLKDLVLSKAYEELKGSNTKLGVLKIYNNNFYLVIDDLKKILPFFDNYDEVLEILNGKNYTPEFDSHIIEDVLHSLDVDSFEFIKNVLLVNFSGVDFTLNSDYIEDFYDWAKPLNKNIFKIKLETDFIKNLSMNQLEILLNNVDFLKKFKENLIDVYKNVYKQQYNKEILYDIYDRLGKIFGSFEGENEYVDDDGKTKSGYYFKYDFLLEDIQLFADEYIWHEEELPDSVYRLLMEIIDDKKSNRLNDLYIDFEYFEPNEEMLGEKFNEKLYEELPKIEF